MRFRTVPILIIAAQFVVLPALGAFAGAWATGFFEPAIAVPADLNEAQTAYWQLLLREEQDMRDAGIHCGLFAGFLTALSFCTSSALRAGRPILHLIAVTILLPVAYLLWIQPLWSFHHMQTLGLLGWYFVDYEEGRNVGPSPCTALPTLALWVGFVFEANSVLREILAGWESPAPLRRVEPADR